MDKDKLRPHKRAQYTQKQETLEIWREKMLPKFSEMEI